MKPYREVAAACSNDPPPFPPTHTPCPIQLTFLPMLIICLARQIAIGGHLPDPLRSWGRQGNGEGGLSTDILDHRAA